MLVVVAGFIALGIVLKMCGYPDNPTVRWNPLALFLREQGVWLLLLPVAWVAVASYVQRLDRGLFCDRVAWIIGLCIAVLITGLFLYAAVFPYTRPLLFYFG